MTALLRVGLAGLCVAAVCSAQDAPPKTSYSWEVFRVPAKGQPESIGSEAVEVTTAEGQRVIASKSTLSLGPQPLELTQRLVVDASGEFVRYSLKSGTHDLSCERGEGGVVLSGKVMGGDQQRTLQPEGLLICLDNLAWSHYDVLGQHAAKRGQAFGFTALVPQAMLGIPARFAPGDEAEVTDGEASRKARRGRLSAGNLLVEVVYDQGSGRVYEVQVPGQRLLARRGAWRLASAAPAAPVAALPEGVRERAVSVPTPGYAPGLPGALTLPAGDGPFPTALLLSGSGPHDLDETIGPNKPLRDLAWQLAAGGVASLRVAKRTQVVLERMKASNGEEQRALSTQLAGMGLEEEYLEDAQAALAFLRAQEGVDPAAIALVGHSLGALLAPEIARAGEVQAVVLLAGPGRRLDAVLTDQVLAGQLRLGKTPAEAEAATREILAPVAGLAEAEAAPEGRFMGASLAYWKDVFARDPVQSTRELAVPVCVVWGERDAQVTLPDFEALKGVVLARVNRKDGMLRFPGLNHLFMSCDEGAAGEEYMIPGRVAPQVGPSVARWIRDALAE